MAKHARGKSRVVLAPEPELMAGQLAPYRVLTVRLKPREDVEWFWTSLAQGGRYVSGYRILNMMDVSVTAMRKALESRSRPA